MSLVYKTKLSPFWYLKATRKSTGTTSRAKAETYAKQVAAETWSAEKLGIKLFTWADMWRTWEQVKAHKKSFVEDVRVSREACAFFEKRGKAGDGVDLSEVDSQDILNYRDLVKNRASESTANNHLRILRAMFNNASKHGFNGKKPCFTLFPKNLAVREKIAKQCPDFEKVEKVVALVPDWVGDIIHAGAYTGMRYSNVAGLRWDWLNETRTMAYPPATATKTQRTYTVPLSSKARDLIAKREATRTCGCPFVFCRCAEGISGAAKSIKFWFGRAQTQVGVTFRFHDLRHMFASMHMRKGTPDRIIQEMVGWSSPAMLQNYVHTRPDDLAKYADAI